VLAVSREIAYAVGEAGTIIYTVDGGNTWETDPCDTDNTLRDVSLSRDRSAIWITGEWGMVLTTQLESGHQVSASVSRTEFRQ
jgi:photosystem II stability/assembly factor-like uncharacterized protein